MKMNKKLIVVPFLSTVVGLSLAGGIGGAFAWYQFNSQVTASFVGSSVADTTLLQIGHYEAGTSGQEMKWGKDFFMAGSYNATNKFKLVPVTFGEITEDAAPGATAYGYPEAGRQGAEGYSKWTSVDANDGYVQFDIYLRALNADKTQAQLAVFLNDVTIQGVMTSGKTEGQEGYTKDISKALRIHLAVDGGTNRLISKDAVSDMDLYGQLDLDGDGAPDTYGGYSWEPNYNTPITYGTEGDKQTTLGISDIVQARDASGYMPESTDPNYAKRICITKGNTDNVKITVTAWLEGWAQYDHAGVDDDTGTASYNEHTNAIWDPTLTADVDVRIGLRFDTGKIRA